MSEDITKNEVESDVVETNSISEEKKDDLVSVAQVQELEAGENAGVETGETVESATEEIQRVQKMLVA